VDRAEAGRLLSKAAREWVGFDAESSDRLRREMLPDLPDLTAVPVIARQTRDLWDGHWAAMTHALVAAEHQGPVEIAAITGPFARDCADWDVSVGTILHTYQRGHQRVWQAWMDRLTPAVADPEARAAVLALCAEILLDYVTASMELTVQVHAAEQEMRLRGASWQLRDDVLAVLEERAVGTPVQLCSRLGHRLDHSQLAFVCWSVPDSERKDRAGLEATAREWVAAAFPGAPVPLLVPVDGASTWGWVARAGRLEDPQVALPAPRPGFRVATGRAAAGVEGFRRSHAEALQAQALALTDANHAAVTRFADVATLALLTDDLAKLRRFVWDQLGGLAIDAEREQRLRATVHAYLEGGANVRAASQELQYHRNTIQQRLDLAATLRGRPLEEDQAGLALALRIAAHYGAAMLHGKERVTPD
jgi:hypothetical protein